MHSNSIKILNDYQNYLNSLPTSLIEKQIERQALNIVKQEEKYDKKIEKGSFTSNKAGLLVMSKMIPKLIDGLVEIKENGGSKFNNILKELLDLKLITLTDKHIDLIKLEDVAYIALKTTLENTENIKKSLKRTAIEVVNNIIIQIKDNIVLNENPKWYETVSKNQRTTNIGMKIRNNIYRSFKVLNKDGIVFKNNVPNFDEATKVAIGSKIISLIITKTGFITVKTIRKTNTELTTFLDFTEDAKKQLKDIHDVFKNMKPFKVAMLIKPKPWTNVIGGGFLNNEDINDIENDVDLDVLSTLFVRTKNKKALLKLKETNMDQVYNAVNTIQETVWEVNKEMFEFINDLYENGVELKDSKDNILLYSKFKKQLIENTLTEDATPEEIKKYKKEQTIIHNYNADVLSEKKTLNIKMNILKDLATLEEFYFCWNVDYRGRIYPVQPLVNPQGDDFIKSLLRFKNGKELGKNGLYWLKIQVANTAGQDKLNFNDRIEWVNNNIKNIRLAAEKPLEYFDFFKDFDSPFMFLAIAKELNEALKLQDPSKFINKIAVAMDGSCSGLQHWSAILKDEITAKGVNLIQNNKPQDVYAQVAETLLKLLKEDKKEQLSYLWLESNLINRKLTKRPTMTTPYGVFQFGIREQVIEILRELKVDKKYFQKDALTYLVKMLDEALKQTVVSAREGMKYLQNISKIITKEEDENIYFKTPLGFVVYQDYYKDYKKTIKTFFGGVRYNATITTKTKEINNAKSANGIAPNFIHSLDATHLMLVVNNLKNNHNLNNFHLIHDSFGTLAADTELLNTVLREEFYNLYTNSNVLKNLFEQFEARYSTELIATFPKIPEVGKLDLAEILKSHYLFS